MELNRRILNYLIEKNRPCSCDELCSAFEMDSFFIEKALNQLVDSLKVKEQNGKYMFADYKIGVLTISKNGRYYVSYDDTLIKISQNKLNGASVGDLVLVNILRNKANSVDGEIVCVKEHYKKVNEGTTINIDGNHYIKPDDDDILVSVGDYLVDGERVSFNKGKLIRNNIYSGSIVSHIGNTNDQDIDALNCLYKYHVVIPFSSKTMAEVKDLPQEVIDDDIKSRVDLRDEQIFTIDGDDAKDLDDAVSLSILSNGNYLVKVSIADVSHYVKKGSAIDCDARERGTSVYYPGRVVPMLPNELSSGICSLFGGVDRLTMTCEMEIDKKGNVLNHKIYESVINSKKRMTYNKVNEVLSGNTPDDYKDFELTLKRMNELKDILYKKRLDNGSIEFDTDESIIEVDADGKVIDIHNCQRGDAEKLIEELMLIANTTVSTHLSKTGNPSLYRVHEKPDVMKVNSVIKVLRQHGEDVPNITETDSKSLKKVIDSLSDSPNRKAYIKLLLFCMTKAVYSVENCGHYGLAFDNYTHFTSPIRRYPDLTIHRLLKEYKKLGDVDRAYLYEQKMYLAETAKHSSLKEHNADRCERDIDQIKMSQYMTDYIGDEFDGSIIKINKYGMTIQLYNGVTGLISYNDMPTSFIDQKKMIVKTPYRLYQLGDRLTIEVASTNTKKGEIKFKEKVLKK